MFPFTDVFDLFPDKFSRLSARRFALPLVPAGPFECLFFRHTISSNPRLTWVRPCRTIWDPVLILSKILIVVSLVGLLRCSAKFRSMSRELDENAYTALRRIMHATEECGYPPQIVPLLMLLTALCFVLSMFVTAPGVR